MGFRFRKRIKILPGLYINLSKSGASASVGTKGATVNIGKNGVRGTVGIPGTGISYSENLTPSAHPHHHEAEPETPTPVIEAGSGIGNDPPREVSVLLALGILFLPWLFSWFLLRPGYSGTARTVGFSWLALVVYLATR